MKSALAVTAIISALSGAANADPLPLNPDVTPETIDQTICVPGYTRTIRPPVSYTNRIKKLRIQEAGLPLELIGDFQLDHKLSLSLGGHPTDPSNLVLEDNDEAHQKDRIEACLPRAVCDGRVGLREAQSAIWNDFRKAAALCRK